MRFGYALKHFFYCKEKITIMRERSIHINQPFPGYRHDRYDSQPMYWFEGEVQAEWEKTTSRTRGETAEFQIETNVGEALLEAVAPVNLDTSSLGSAGLGYSRQIQHVNDSMFSYVYSNPAKKKFPHYGYKKDKPQLPCCSARYSYDWTWQQTDQGVTCSADWSPASVEIRESVRCHPQVSGWYYEEEPEDDRPPAKRELN